MAQQSDEKKTLLKLEPQSQKTQGTHPSDASKVIPRYLYRVYAPDSMGLNIEGVFKSEAHVQEQAHRTLTQIPHKDANVMLEKHFRWDPPNSEFISWTSSLLWALLFALRKTVHPANPRFASAKQDIKLCVLDTSFVNHDHFYSAPSLIAKYTALLNAGLYNLIPELDSDEKEKLRSRVLDLRGVLFAHAVPVGPIGGGLALWIASLFGKHFVMPMFVAFLSLRRRIGADEGFLRAIRQYAVPSRDFLASFPNYQDSVEATPELVNFANMMNEASHEVDLIRARAVGEDSPLVTGFTQLGIKVEEELRKKA
ncbi:hypothetical protein ACLMJK_003506 [Lecanora helva]